MKKKKEILKLGQNVDLWKYFIQFVLSSITFVFYANLLLYLTLLQMTVDKVSEL